VCWSQFDSYKRPFLAILSAGSRTMGMEKGGNENGSGREREDGEWERKGMRTPASERTRNENEKKENR
jgi:hypothetical protein